MKLNRLSASLLLLASSVAKCSAAPHNGTASIAPRMNQAPQGDIEGLVARMKQLYDTGGGWIEDMIKPVDYNQVDDRDLDRGHARTAGWTRNDKTGAALPRVVHDIHKLDGVEGLPQCIKAAPAVSMHRPGWHWMESEQNKPYYVQATGSWEAPTMWSYHGLYHRTQRAIVITKAYSEDLNTTPNQLPPEKDHLPAIHEWGQMTWMEYRQDHARSPAPPVRVFYFPALQGNREDVGLIRYVAGHFTGRDLLLPKPGVTFPLGSYGHQALLGSILGVQVSKLLEDNKLYTGPAVVVSISIWDSGMPGGKIPSVLFNIERYDARVQQARQANIDAGGLLPLTTDWPYKFLPHFVR